MAGQNARRTAAASGTSDLAHPVVSFGRYVGGAVRSDQLLAADLDGDGTQEILFVSGGKLIAKHADDQVIWETAPLNLGTIVAVEDFDGDGRRDVVAVGSPGLVAIFDARDGHLEWRTGDTFGPGIGAVRVADFNGDGHPDLYVADANCGSARQRGDIAFAYTFGAGFGTGVEDARSRLWQLERGRDYVCGVNDTLADLNGDGRPEVLAFSSTHAWVFDGATGQKISSGNDAAPAFGGYDLGFSVPYGVLTTDVVDVDGDARPEIVGYTNNSYDPSINSRAAFVLAWNPTQPAAQRLAVRWRAQVADLTMDAHTFQGDGAADLNRDGFVEVASTFTEGGVATTYVRSGAGGAVLAQIPGATIAGIYDVGADRPRILAVRRGAALEGYAFATLPVAGALPAPVFSIPGASVLRATDFARRRRQSAWDVALTLPDPDGTHRAIVVRVGNALELWSVARATPARVASRTLAGLEPIALAPERGIERAGDGLLLARSDGYLLVLGGNLDVLNLGSDEIPLPGVRVGGFYSGGCGSLSAPVAAGLGTPASAVVLADSRGVLLRLDAHAATRVAPPPVVWEWPGAQYPMLIDTDGDSAREVVALTDGARTLAVRRADGVTRVWDRTVPARATERMAGFALPLAGRTGLRFALSTLDSGTGEGRVYAVSSLGDALFATTPIVTAGSGQGQLSALDVDGDGQDDALISMQAPLRMYSGATGASLGDGPATYVRLPVVTRGAVAGVDAIGAGGHYSIDGLAMSASAPYAATARWSLPATYAAGTFSGCHGAVVQCPDGVRFANAKLASSELVIADAATGVVRADVALGGGAIYASEATLSAAGVVPGTLGNVTATRSLDGAPAFLVGSTDGYLYAVDPCSASTRLTWALNLRAPVGEAVFADTDGDGQDEIVVTAADGFVYGIDTERFPAPAYVYDTDPPAHAMEDVDELAGSALSVRWAPVPNATGYQWALFTLGGTAITRNAMDPANPFIDAPASATTASHGFELVNDQRYFFAVRALGPGGVTSAETVSDGVHFTRSTTPLADAGVDAAARDAAGGDAASASDGGAAGDGGGPGSTGGCGCRAAGRTSARGSALALLAALALVARIPRRRRR